MMPNRVGERHTQGVADSGAVTGPATSRWNVPWRAALPQCAPQWEFFNRMEGDPWPRVRAVDELRAFDARVRRARGLPAPPEPELGGHRDRPVHLPVSANGARCSRCAS